MAIICSTESMIGPGPTTMPTRYPLSDSVFEPPSRVIVRSAMPGSAARWV